MGSPSNPPDHRCPVCGAAVDSRDEPCPTCEAIGDTSDELVPYTYYKSFRNRSLVRYRPDNFVAVVNEWLAGERGLMDVTMQVQVDRYGLVNGMTLSCFGFNKPTQRSFELVRLVLVKGAFAKRGAPTGEALNTWKERNPDKVIRQFWQISTAGVIVEVWILSVGTVPVPAATQEVSLQPE